jgi:nicotinamidase-related amidase
MESQEGRNLPVPHCIKDTWGWESVDELNPHAISELNGSDNWYIVDKPTFGHVGVWMGLNFSQLVNDQNVEVTLCGTCTDICVVSNVMIVKSLYPEMVVNVKADACAGLTPEKHKAALDVMSSCQINII